MKENFYHNSKDIAIKLNDHKTKMVQNGLVTVPKKTQIVESSPVDTPLTNGDFLVQQLTSASPAAMPNIAPVEDLSPTSNPIIQEQTEITQRQKELEVTKDECLIFTNGLAEVQSMLAESQQKLDLLSEQFLNMVKISNEKKVETNQIISEENIVQAEPSAMQNNMFDNAVIPQSLPQNQSLVEASLPVQDGVNNNILNEIQQTELQPFTNELQPQITEQQNIIQQTNEIPKVNIFDQIPEQSISGASLIEDNVQSQTLNLKA